MAKKIYHSGSMGMLRVALPLELKKLNAIFRHKVLRMLLNKGEDNAGDDADTLRMEAYGV